MVYWHSHFKLLIAFIQIRTRVRSVLGKWHTNVPPHPTKWFGGPTSCSSHIIFILAPDMLLCLHKRPLSYWRSFHSDQTNTLLGPIQSLKIVKCNFIKYCGSQNRGYNILMKVEKFLFDFEQYYVYSNFENATIRVCMDSNDHLEVLFLPVSFKYKIHFLE